MGCKDGLRHCGREKSAPAENWTPLPRSSFPYPIIMMPRPSRCGVIVLFLVKGRLSLASWWVSLLGYSWRKRYGVERRIEEKSWLISREQRNIAVGFGVHTSPGLSRATARSSAPLSPSPIFPSYRPYFVSLGMFVVNSSSSEYLTWWRRVFGVTFRWCSESFGSWNHGSPVVPK
jgi:hypothetical protein